MVDPQRLRDEIEIHDAIERHRARQRSDKVWAIGLLVLALHALTHYWIFVRPKRLDLLTPLQIQFRRRLWIVVTGIAVIALYVVGMFS